MKFYKYFSLTIIYLLIIICFYLGITFIYKKHQEHILKSFYQQQQNIALSQTQFNQPFAKPKFIPKNKPVRILVLEGGGLRGIMSAEILDYIEKTSHQHISDLFDIIYGTSIGALTGSFLSIPDENGQPKFWAIDLIKFIKQDANKTLTASNSKKFLSGYGLISPIFNYAEYTNILHTYMDNVQLSQLTTNVVVDAYSLKQKQVMFFSSRQDNLNQDNFLIYQLISGVTAIPGVIPPQEIYPLSKNESDLLVDASLVNNNPTLAALVYANTIYPDNEKIIVFIGLGYSNIANDNIFNGILGSMVEYSHMFRGGSRDKLLKFYIDELSVSHKLGIKQENVFYIDETLSTRIGSSLDKSDKNITSLENIAKSIIQQQKPALTKLINKLDIDNK